MSSDFGQQHQGQPRLELPGPLRRPRPHHRLRLGLDRTPPGLRGHHGSRGGHPERPRDLRHLRDHRDQLVRFRVFARDHEAVLALVEKKVFFATWKDVGQDLLSRGPGTMIISASGRNSKTDSAASSS